MRVVHHDECVVAVGKGADLVERCVVSVHRKDTVGDDQSVAGVDSFLQPRLEFGHVTVCVAVSLRLAEPNTVDDARVVERVRDHRVALVEESLEHSAVSVETGGEQDRVFLAKPRRQPLLQLTVDVLRATDEADRRHAEPAFLQGLGSGRNHARVISQSEVVVGAEVQDLATLLVPDMRSLRARQDALRLEYASLLHLGDPG